MTEPVESLQDITEYVEKNYNQYISVYDYSSHVRVTNGSAAHKADIRVSDGRLKIEAERYGETYSGTHEPTVDGLQAALHNGLGL
jgi:hypothetical protein